MAEASGDSFGINNTDADTLVIISSDESRSGHNGRKSNKTTNTVSVGAPYRPSKDVDVPTREDTVDGQGSVYGYRSNTVEGSRYSRGDTSRATLRAVESVGKRIEHCEESLRLILRRLGANDAMSPRTKNAGGPTPCRPSWTGSVHKLPPVVSLYEKRRQKCQVRLLSLRKEYGKSEKIRGTPYSSGSDGAKSSGKMVHAVAVADNEISSLKPRNLIGDFSRVGGKVRVHAGCSRDQSEDRDAAFSAWVEENGRRRVDTQLMSIGVVSGNWFLPMWSPCGRLTDEHIDALLGLLLLKRRRDPDKYGRCWSLLDVFAWETLRSSDFSNAVLQLHEYITGWFPIDGGEAWSKCTSIYGVGIINRDHWVCYELSLLSRKITVYNSLQSAASAATIYRHFETLARRLPHLFTPDCEGTKRRRVGQKLEAWEIEVASAVPQQVNGDDCGILAAKFVEHLARGLPLSAVNPRRCIEYRKSYCMELAGLQVGD